MARIVIPGGIGGKMNDHQSERLWNVIEELAREGVQILDLLRTTKQHYIEAHHEIARDAEHEVKV